MTQPQRASTIALAFVFLAGCTSATVAPQPTTLSSTPGSVATPVNTRAPSAKSTQTGSQPPTATPTPTTASPTDNASLVPSASAAVATSPPATPSAPTLPPLPTAEPGSIVALLASGYGNLTFVTNAGDGSNNLYVVEQGGRVYRLSPGQSAPGNLVLDIKGEISAGGERGLLGLAFHPDFASNRRFFINFTDENGDTVIAELTAISDGTPNPGAERLLQVDQPFSNHNGGMLAFGPDGYLYIGLGDGGSGGDPQGNGQNLQALLGKILRIDVDSGDAYGIPASNPFVDAANGVRPEIWDWGVRNPWRFSFDRESGGLFIGEVGQGNWEEIDVQPAGSGGRNYGWNVMEGTHCYSASQCDQTGLTFPVAEYSHADGCSVTGGYVYRGSRWPNLVGRYFYADYCSGTVWSFDAAAALAGEPVTPEVFGKVPFNVSSFGEDEAGELYIVDASGSIYVLVQPS